MVVYYRYCCLERLSSRALRHTYIKSVNCNVLNLVLIDFFIYRNRCGFSPFLQNPSNTIGTSNANLAIATATSHDAASGSILSLAETFSLLAIRTRRLYAPVNLSRRICSSNARLFLSYSCNSCLSCSYACDRYSGKMTFLEHPEYP
jgi:hypothetical protein